MSQRLGVLRRVLAGSGLRRVELAFLGFGAAEYGVWVSVLVYAYKRGGTTEAALVAVLQLVPAAVVAPSAARLADSRGGGLALWIGYGVQALATGTSAACMLLSAPAVTVYAGAVLAASGVTLIRPAQGALLPQLVGTAAQLTAANVVSGWVESLSLLLGPAVAGALIGLHGPGAALAAFAGALVFSALLVAPLRRGGGRAAIVGEGASRTVAAVVRSAPVMALLTVGAVQFAVIGALDVMEVVLALKVLGLGASGAGYLAAAYGAGAIAGAVGSVALVGRRRLVIPLLGAGIGMGLSLVLLGAWPTAGGAFALLAATGATHALLDVSGRTLLHRAVPRELHGRVFGVLEGLAMLGLAVGSLLVPLLTGAFGADIALVCLGGVLIAVPAGVASLLAPLERAAPAYEEQIALLRGSPLFAMLGATVLEDLAGALTRIELPEGHTLIRQGDPGDHFYLLAEGELEVFADGSLVRVVPAGDGVGEIALLRDGIRTATVRTTQPSVVYALEREPFLEAVTGSYQAHRAGEQLVLERLGG